MGTANKELMSVLTRVVSAPRRVFYGWWIVLACATIHFYIGAVFYYGFGAFFTPLIREFGWSRAAASFAFSLQRLEGGIVGPIVGFIIDRLGARKLIIFGMAVAGAGFLLFSRVTSLLTFYGAFLVISFGLSAGFGAPFSAAAVNWFVRMRGKALGFLWSGAGFSGLLIPALVGLIAAVGWRTALVIVGLGCWLICIPAGAVVRHRPEPYGYRPDGAPADLPSSTPADTAVPTSPAQESGGAGERWPGVELTAREALGTRAFWLLSLSGAVTGMTTGALFVHQIPFLEGIGIPREQAALSITFLTLTSLIGRMGFGLVADRFDKRAVLAAIYGFQTVGMLFLASVRSFWQVFLFLAAYGPSYGGAIPLRPALQGDYFGRRHFASIQGLMNVTSVFGGIAGPVFAGWVYDVTGGYRLAFLVFAAVGALGVPLILAATPPRVQAAVG